ncbi:MAG: hypothetical protein E6J91_46370 [Deltaproteobacteria bacterium]|nr:MAG: hypothetical protein E6J91_46370 [Deltaproteobacteria bacterium]
MAPEVHRIVEEPDDLHGAGAQPVEHNVPRGPATLGDVKAANARRISSRGFPPLGSFAIASMAS